MKHIYDDGGAAEAGFTVDARDCVVRAFAIASGKPYAEVRQDLLTLTKQEKRKDGRRSTPRGGVFKETQHALAKLYGFTWTPTMRVGSGTTVHVREGEVPATGRHVLSVTKHAVALVDGDLHDTFDPSRGGTRAVYGYWSAPSD
jgi:hypothetical protein